MVEGIFRISRVQGTFDADEEIRVELQDKSSGVAVVSLRMSLLEFSNALFCRHSNACTFEVGDVDMVGKERETKRVIVDRPKLWRTDPGYDAELDAILAPHEVDGWKCSRQDMGNHHYYVGDDSVSVSFTRLVDPTSE